MHKRQQDNQQGFTMIEILVTMAIFVSAVSSLSAIFLYSNQSQRKTQAIQQTQSDSRFAMEVIAQQVRKGSIDYASTQYGGTIASNPQDVLVLRDTADNQVWFRRNEVGGRGVIEMSENGTLWVELTPPDLSITLLKFYISPSADPFIASPATNQQPMVTIVMTSSNISIEGEGLPSVSTQTTVTSRQYVR